MKYPVISLTFNCFHHQEIYVDGVGCIMHMNIPKNVMRQEDPVISDHKCFKGGRCLEALLHDTESCFEALFTPTTDSPSHRSGPCTVTKSVVSWCIELAGVGAPLKRITIQQIDEVCYKPQYLGLCTAKILYLILISTYFKSCAILIRSIPREID